MNAPFDRAIAPASGLRLVAVITGAVAFGLLAANTLTPPSSVAVPLFSLGYAAAFSSGAFHAILISFLRGETPKPVAADWAGGVAGVAIFAAGASLLLALAGIGAVGVLAALSVALNLSYAPAKAGCLAAGCCGAQRPLPFVGYAVDLRVAEILMCAMALALTALVWPVGPEAAAVVGLAAHVALRLFSRRFRRLVDRNAFLGGREIAPLALCIGLAAAS